MLVRTKLQL